MEEASVKFGFHYELDSGSVLGKISSEKNGFTLLCCSEWILSCFTGAIKLHNFIPWDIDGDIHLPNNTMQHFHKNGTARKFLEDHGILFHAFYEDNSADIEGAKNAGL